MTNYLRTVRKSDDQERFYVGGCRVSSNVFYSVGDGDKSSFITKDTGKHWRFYHSQRL